MSEFTPGQSIRCTINSVPASQRGKDTILRLMRQDDGIRASLRRGQKERKRTTRMYIRGGRDFFIRPRAGKVAKVAPGESWQMAYIPHLEGDLKSIEKHISTEVV